MKSVTMNVEGMSCNGCAERIHSAMAEQPGVKTTDVSFEKARARVPYDPHTFDENHLVETVQKLGYRVVERTAS